MNIKKCLFTVAIAYGIFQLFDWLFYNVLPNHYVFDPVVLQDISKKVLQNHPNGDINGIFEELAVELKKEYGDIINDYNTEDWFFNNAGNAMGTMFILHASISEYLIFFGSAVGTEGHTGIHFADDYFTILKGRQLASTPTIFEPELYLPGDQHHLRKGYTKQYSMPSESFLLELAQGWIPAMLPFGFLDCIFSTLDFPTFLRTCYFTAISMGGNLMRGKF